MAKKQRSLKARIKEAEKAIKGHKELRDSYNPGWWQLRMDLLRKRLNSLKEEAGDD